MTRPKKILVWLVTALVLITIGAYVLIPRIIEAKIYEKAQSYKLKIDFESINIGIDQITLNKLSISSPFFPKQHAILNKVDIEIDWFTPKRILVNGGDVELIGSPNYIKQQIADWRNRDGHNSPSKIRTSLLDKISVENLSLVWKDWQPGSKLQLNGLYFKDRIITIDTAATVAYGKNVQIDTIRFGVDKPTNLDFGIISITQTESDTGPEEKSELKDFRIPSVPKIPEPITIRVRKGIATHHTHTIRTTEASVSITHGDLVGVNVSARQVSIDTILLDEFNSTITFGIDEESEIWIDTSAKTLKFGHATLLDQKIEIDRPTVRAEITVKPKRLELKNGHIGIDRVDFDISGFYNSEWIRGKIQMPQVSCQDLLDSVPLAMKPTINGMKLEGSMAWEVHGDVDVPDRSNTSIRVKLKNGCKVISVPDAISINKLRKPFKRYVYDANNKLVEIDSGPGVPGWTPLSLTSMFVPIAIQTMEDPGFMTHHGFDIQAIENSIRDNIKEGRFAKGASTISMQLAKNLWLNRDKTISRKVQEAFLTIYLEQKLRKDEILELYTSIVEFGPNIYGIGKASPHYFKKHPANLTLGQAMFLASILPKPKNYYFDANGKLIPGKLKFLHRAMKAMRDRKIISEDEYQQGILETIAFGQASTNAEEDVIVEDDGISPDSWTTN
jgi:hypothetical protein